MKFNLILLLGVSIAVAVGHAGGGSEAGNGGSSIVCQDSSGNLISVELLDFYEGRVQRNLNVDLGPKTDSVETKLSLAIQRLKKLGMDSDSTEHLEEIISHFSEYTKFYSGIRLVEVPDSANLLIPSRCRQEQIAVWKDPSVPEDRIFNINQDLWDHLDNDNRAGLILHESLYYLVKMDNSPDITDSRIVRYLTSKTSSSEAENWNAFDFLNVLRKLSFKKMVNQGMIFKITEVSPRFHLDGVLGGGTLAESHPIQFQGQRIEINEIELEDYGKINSFTPAQAVALKVDGQDVWFPQNLSLRVRGDQLEAGAAAYNNQNIFSRPNSYHLQLKSVGKKPVIVSFDLDGSLHQCNSCVGTAVFRGQSLPVGVVPAEEANTDDLPPISYFADAGCFQAYLASASEVKVNGQEILFERTFIFDRPRDFTSEQRILGFLAQDTQISVGEKLVKMAKGQIEFHPSDKLKRGVLAENAVLADLDGKMRTYLAGTEIAFREEDGRVESATISDKALFQRRKMMGK